MSMDGRLEVMLSGHFVGPTKMFVTVIRTLSLALSVYGLHSTVLVFLGLMSHDAFTHATLLFVLFFFFL